jgi:NAD(P)-dependent dehydrogenase (short-subunit alcohol dehydrogenase family)
MRKVLEGATFEGEAVPVLPVLHPLDARELAGTPIKINAGAPGFVATDFNNFAGTRTPDEGAAIALKLATLAADGPEASLTIMDLYPGSRTACADWS